MSENPSVSRRSVLRASALLAALPLLAACGGSASTTAATSSAAGSTASAPASSSVAASSPAASSALATSSAPASSASATTSAAGSTSASASSSAPASTSVSASTSGAAGSASTSTASSAEAASVKPTPTFVPVTAALPQPTKSAAKITDRWIVLQDEDFNPAHNAYVRKGIQDYAKFQGWQLDVSYVSGFSAGGDLFQKLGAAINAGQPPDLLGKDLSGYQMKFLNLLDEQDALAKEMIQKFGTPIPGMQLDTIIDGKWWGVPWFTRSGGYFARKSWFDSAGLDYTQATSTLNGLPDALLKISDPSKKHYGWGMTINTSGDGESLVQATLLNFGSRLTDATGQLVKLDSPETVTAVTWLTDIYTNAKWKNMLPPGVNSWTDPSNNEAWLAGQIGFTSNAGTLYAQSRQQNNSNLGDDSFLIQQPAGPDGKRLQGAGGNRWWIFRGSKNMEASQDFIRYMLDPVAQTALFTYTPGYVLPAYANLWNQPEIQNQPVAKAFQPVAFTTPPFSGLAYPGPSTAASAAVNSANVYTKMTARVLQGAKPADSVKQAAQEAIQIYQQYGMKGQ